MGSSRIRFTNRCLPSFCPLQGNRNHRGTSGRQRLDRVDLSREDEVALGEAVYFVRPDRNLDLTPAEADVGVVPLLLGELAHLIDEAQSLAEVLEPEDPPQVVLLDDLPFGDLSLERAKLLSLERRCSALARHARFARKFGHPVPPIETNFREVACVVALASSPRRRFACTAPLRAGYTPWPPRDRRYPLPPLLFLPGSCTPRRTVLAHPTGVGETRRRGCTSCRSGPRR